MVKFLILQIKLHKLTLEDVKERYPQYYEEVLRELEK